MIRLDVFGALRDAAMIYARDEHSGALTQLHVADAIRSDSVGVLLVDYDGRPEELSRLRESVEYVKSR